MTTIIAYTYEADIQCPNCTRNRFGDAVDDDLNPPVDQEGNPIHPVFMTDEIDINNCGICGDELRSLADPC